MLRVSFWVFWYIYCLLSKTGPDRCRETRGTGTKEVARKPRQDFSIQKGPVFFSSLWLSMRSNQRKMWALLAPFKIGHVAFAFWKENEKKPFFIKKPNPLFFFSETSNSPLSPSMLLFLPLLLHHCCLSWSSKFPFISTPNCKEKLFLESRSLPLLRGALNFR